MASSSTRWDTPAEVINKSLVDRAGGRVQSPEFSKDYNGRIEKGMFLLKLLSLGNREAQKLNNDVSIVSRFQNYKALQRWGWTADITWFPFHQNMNGDEGDKPSFGSSLDEAFEDLAFPVSKRQMGVYYFKQDKPFKKSGLKSVLSQRLSPSRGIYINVVNPEAGAFIFNDNFSPSSMVERNHKGNVPDLNALSDIAFLQWENACQYKNIDIKSLKVVFRSNVITSSSRSVIMEALRKSGFEQVPGWSNRAVIPMDTQAGAAIIGSTHGSGVAWMLLQHKQKLGMKTITEVVVWESDGDYSFLTQKSSRYLNLRFTIKDI
ncbi:hypothetical protein LZ30DRAFT_765268 [Colletotrichum cereale]|nr:hypothetical protein LZ30DRAFT_765268 [Colletotrichum cereale]